MTPRAFEILSLAVKLDAAGEDPDIICEGRSCYIGLEPISRKTIDQLLRCTAISVMEMDRKTQIFTVNDTGRAIVRRPELEDEVIAAILEQRGSFTIVDDRLVRF